MPAIDPSSLAGALGPEWSVGDIQANTVDLGALEGAPEAGGSFASVLGKQLTALSELQTQGAEASQALATGTATDPASVVMAVERARLSMQLASQLRTKGVEAINEIFRTQV
ncbi:MAG TPA: flagellar hook-basal body complex protein FliE [Solirubrobacteraceae bacterium]|nr:flagellar hook-basal body complex protein FliE [Solirubrobacteraceae bacterium]